MRSTCSSACSFRARSSSRRTCRKPPRCSTRRSRRSEDEMRGAGRAPAGARRARRADQGRPRRRRRERRPPGRRRRRARGLRRPRIATTEHPRHRLHALVGDRGRPRQGARLGRGRRARQKPCQRGNRCVAAAYCRLRPRAGAPFSCLVVARNRLLPIHCDFAAHHRQWASWAKSSARGGVTSSPTALVVCRLGRSATTRTRGIS